jgi:hypothetical protein
MGKADEPEAIYVKVRKWRLQMVFYVKGVKILSTAYNQSPRVGSQSLPNSGSFQSSTRLPSF